MPRKPDPGARERILDTACRLFDAHGVHAVGMQQIIDEVGCGKNLLYREFQTKDDLVAAYVERGRQSWCVNLLEVADQVEAPADQLLAIVARVAENATAPGFRGCNIYNTHAEFPEPDHPVNRAATENLEYIRHSLFDLASRAGAADPRTLADRLLLIIDGLKVNGAAMGRAGAAAAAVAFAEDTIRNALRPIGASSGS